MKGKMEVLYNAKENYFTIFITFETSFKIVEKRYRVEAKYKSCIDSLYELFDNIDEESFELFLFFFNDISTEYFTLKEEEETNAKA